MKHGAARHPAPTLAPLPEGDADPSDAEGQWEEPTQEHMDHVVNTRPHMAEEPQVRDVM